MVGHPWPKDRNSEVVISSRETGRVERRIVTETPKKLARTLTKIAAARGWTVKGRSPFREMRDDVGAYTYWLERVNAETGLTERKDIDVYFPIAKELYLGAMA